MNVPQLLRPMGEADFADVLRLNAEHVELLSPMDEPRLRQLLGWTSGADVITCDGQTAGFVLVFGPGTDYDSPNYAWFSAQFADRFAYLDRVVVDKAFRRRGLASLVYDDIEARATERERLVLEVNLDPPNTPSLEFHRGRSFRQVAVRGESGHRVSLMAKEVSVSGAAGC
jgi:hypothetical protein